MNLFADDFAMPLEFGVWLLIAVGAVALGGLVYLRRPIGLSLPQTAACVALRVIALGGLLWALAGPSAFEPIVTRQDKVPVLILADTSQSMAQCDVPTEEDPISRWQAVSNNWLSASLFEQLNELGEPIVMQFDEQLTVASQETLQPHEPVGEATRLFEAIPTAIARSGRSDRSGMIVLLTDGNDTQQVTAPALAANLKQAGWRVFAVPVGEANQVTDLSIRADATSDFVFASQPIRIHTSVRAVGVDVAAAQVELYENGQRIRTQTATFSDSTVANITFVTTPDVPKDVPLTTVGYRVLVKPLAEESRQDNNEQHVFVQVSNQQMRVLLLEGDPYWDTRALSRVLRSDPQVQLWAVHSLETNRQHITSPADSSPDDLQVALPVTKQLLDLFDVVILGRSVNRLLPIDRASLLTDFVLQRGGALVFARGEAFESDADYAKALQAVLPAKWSEASSRLLGSRLTEEGSRSPLLDIGSWQTPADAFAQMPDWLTAPENVKANPAAVVLLQHADEDSSRSAAILQQHAGAGRVLAVTGQGMWRWARLPKSLEAYGRFYHQFWSRGIRWAALGGDFKPGQAASLRLSQTATQVGDSITATLHLREAPSQPISPQLLVKHESGTTHTLPMFGASDQATRYAATIDPRQPGVYILQVPDLPSVEHAVASQFSARSDSPERVDLSARPVGIIELAQTTGGKVIPVDQPEQLLKALDAVKAARQTDRTLQLNFNRPVVFAMLLLCLGTEWLLRRRVGLL